MGWLNNAVDRIRSGFQRLAASPAPADDFWYTEYPSKSNAAGVIVTPDIALKAAAVYSCIKVLAETVASLPVAMFRETPDGGHVPAPNHPLDELIRYQPNRTQTAVEFWEMMMLHASVRGTGYAEIVPGPRGAVDQLLPLHAGRVVVETLPDKSLRFRVTDPRTGLQRVLLQEEVFRIPGLSSDGVQGLHAVDLAAEDIGLGMAADSYAARVFSNRLNIGGYLVHPGKLSNKAQRNLVKRLVERFAGIDNAHRPIVLQEGMDFKPATFGAKDSQLTEARKWQITLIAMRWRIPLYLLGIEKSGGNAEQDALDFVKYTLRPWVRRIEQAIRRDLIIATRSFEAKFNMEALLRGDSKSRGEYFSKALGSGGSPAWMTPNEVRAIEGFNRSDQPEADRLGVGTNPKTDMPNANASGGIIVPVATAMAARLWPQMLPDAGMAFPAKGDDERLVRRHVAAVRKAALRFAGDRKAFVKWAAVFFGGEVAAVARAFHIDKDTARAYCAGQEREVVKTKDINKLLARWDETGAAEIRAILSADTEET